MKIKDYLFKFFVYSSALLAFGMFVFLIMYIVINGIKNIDLSIFSINYTSENSSIFPSFVSTIAIILLTLIFSIPFGIGSAIYLTEYANKRNRIIQLISITTQTLAGIPSIVYGLFGMLFFVTKLKLGFSIISGALTLAIMILPIIMETTENALNSVPDSYRQGAFGLGAGKLRTVFSIVLPASMSGILSGIILSIGRIIGESAALIYTAGTVAQLPKSIFSSSRTLAVHVYSLSSEGLHTDKAYATAFILLILILGINLLAKKITNNLKKG
ncbi:phosphate ABC transporter permease PstA [Sneathia sanguinegens]|uniref:Phosphate transport system permease protein PstA n=1 Tax=Sneathia sanguinegens TaxID=40543 RepID=A0ABT7HJF7_9FUSO|nr:phosphate ABC transporter permease PstA [Sneathia sanguinegens]MDK9580666.1 phosphate ABC transporter permease PstA [Sneathia sanguinegens]MDU4652931.1 phosphate ABC transporter permease PstA [Sneathia sanguinegens]MDU7496656.1 phosphate ABC transporter permease PstA [Sneathia sanguinegens]